MEHVKKMITAVQPLEIRILKARELYEAGEDTGLTDAEYDALEAQLRQIDPLNPILKQVGSPRAGKVPLPFPMNGISQVQLGEFDDWRDDCARRFFVVSDKLDGVSVLLHYHDGMFVNAYSRGNGSEGANVSRHIIEMAGQVPRVINSGVRGDMFIRAEIIMAENIFEPIKAKYGYVTARNFVAGQMNREVAMDEFYAGVSLLAYSVYPSNLFEKVEQLMELRNWGFETPYKELWDYDEINESGLIKVLEARRQVCPYAIDGLVITVDSAPDVQVKFKVTSDDSIVTTIVERVEYNVSKDGFLKPTVWVRPVQCGGVTVTKTTGYNAGFIRDNYIGKGAVVKIERRGEVVPNIVEVVSSGLLQGEMPDVDYSWTESGVDAVVCEGSPEVIVQQMVHCFKTLGVFGAGEGNIRKIIDYGNQIVNTHRVTDFPLFASESDWTAAAGANGSKIYKSLQDRLGAVSLETLADAFGTFGRGVGTRTFEACSSVGINFVTAGMGDLLTVPDIAEKTAERIIGGQLDFVRKVSELGLSQLSNHLKAAKVTGTKYASVKIEFTGVRSKELEDIITSNGGKVGSGFNLLVAKDPSANSGKLKKAREKGIEIISLQEARKRFV